MKNSCLKLAVYLGAVLAISGCNQTGSVSSGPEGGEVKSKPPHEFDVSKILYPRIPSDFQPVKTPAPKMAVTYYTFTIGSGISSSDKNRARATTGYGGPEPVFNSTGNTFQEATYSANLASDPENNLWVTDGDWLKAGPAGNNEQTEIHYTWNMLNGTGFSSFWVDVEYSIATEANYDYLYITSTASNLSCNSPGVIRTQVSGTQSGSVGFEIPRDCGTGWLGIYYIKDGSVTSSPEYVKIKNVRIYGRCSVGPTCTIP